jgi:methyl-accepting chemotaxis protein
MHTGTEQVKVGVDLATQAGASLEQIVTGASDVAGMVQSISAAAEEAGAGARQSAEAAGQLSTKAEELQTLVSQFRILSKK